MKLINLAEKHEWISTIPVCQASDFGKINLVSKKSFENNPKAAEWL
ncbi:hypothetical protein [Algoriphagus litoralis]|nr:hypothetical protein [Algoriphagus litoralis]